MATGYGVEAWCLDSYVSGRYARGAMVVAQSIYRRLTTPRGMLRGGEDERNGGLDLSEYVGAVGTKTALAALPNLVRGEILKDDRVASVSVRAIISTDSAGDVSIVLDISATLESEGESFALSVGVDDTSTALLNVSAP